MKQAVEAYSVMRRQSSTFYKLVIFNLGYAKTAWGYAKTSYIDQNETQEPPEPWTSSDPRTNEDSFPNWGAGMPEQFI
jgi:hypothetical protein